MKSILTWLVAIIIINSLFIATNSRVHNSKHKSKEVNHNHKNYRFYYGLVTVLIGKKAENFDQCFPQNWNEDMKPADAENVMNNLIANQAILSKITIVLSSKIDNYCKQKKTMIEDLVRRVKDNNRRRRRMFLERKSHSHNTKFSKARFSKKATHKSKSHKSKTKSEPFDTIESNIVNLKNSIAGFFESPLLSSVDTILSCLSEKYPQVKGLKDMINDFQTKKASFKKGDDYIVKVLVDSLCNWRLFKKSIQFLNAAFKAKNDLTRWVGFGSFLGRLVTTLADS